MAKSTRITSELKEFLVPKRQTNASLIASQSKTIPIKPPAKEVVLLKKQILPPGRPFV